MTWKGWLIAIGIGAGAYLLGSYFGIPGQGTDSKLLAEVEEAKAEAGQAAKESMAHLQQANELRAKLTELQQADTQTETEVIQLPAETHTLEACKRSAETLRRRAAVVTEQRDISEAESFELRSALRVKSLETNRLRDALAAGDKRYTVLERSRKKEKRRRIAGLVVSHVAVFGIGYGIGTIQ